MAEPIASRVMCEFVGLAPDSHHRLAPLLRDIADVLVRDYISEVRRRGTAAIDELDELVEDSVEDAPVGSALAYPRERQSSGELTHQEVVDLVTLLAFAGYSNSADLLSNLIANLFSPATDLTSIESELYVEECLRLSTPVQSVARHATADLVISGTPITRGSLVLLQLAAANRDRAHGGAAPMSSTRRRSS